MSDTADTAAPGRQTKRGPSADLDSMTVAELTALRDAVEAKRLEKLDAEKAAVLSETRAKLAALGVSFDDMLRQPPAGQGKGKRRSGSTVAPKYKGPNGELWSGRGREPQWVKDAKAQGKDMSEFLIRAS